MSDKTTVSVRLDGELAEELEQLTGRAPYDIPKSEVIRTALREHFERKKAFQ